MIGSFICKFHSNCFIIQFIDKSWAHLDLPVVVKNTTEWRTFSFFFRDLNDLISRLLEVVFEMIKFLSLFVVQYTESLPTDGVKVTAELDINWDMNNVSRN